MLSQVQTNLKVKPETGKFLANVGQWFAQSTSNTTKIIAEAVVDQIARGTLMQSPVIAVD